MKYLVPALICEGPTDRDFLEPLLLRLIQRLAEQPIEIQGFIDPTGGRRSIADRIDSLRREFEAFDLVFLHADGRGQPEQVIEQQVNPIKFVVNELRRRCVGVVPVHETEAWALADAGAIADVLGTRRSAEELGIPSNPNQLESLQDPKDTLRLVGIAAHGGRKVRRSRGPSLRALGECTSIDSLMRVAAFRRTAEELHEQLHRWLDPANE